MKKRGQVAAFVIIALVIVVGIVVYFVIRNNLGKGDVSPELTGIFDYYQNCVEYETRNAIGIIGAQGGKIDVGEYTPGSDFAPFSSHLNFLGMPIRYWYFVSANGVIKEDVPSIEEMEKEIENYIVEGLEKCDFESFYKQGFEITRGRPQVNIDIRETKVAVNVEESLSVSKEGESAIRSDFDIEIDSKLGKFYQLALNIYNREKEESFLEMYALDSLYLYAPVDGADIQCGPKIWATQKVIGDLKEAIENNFATIKFKGNYYDIKDKKREYFVVDENADEVVGVVYSANWPTRIEIDGEGVDEEIIISEAVGTQGGLGIMGFCYVPYHFVYDIKLPALVQIYNNDELFQFPVVVVIENNLPRSAEFSSVAANGGEEFDLCAYKNQPVEINVYDINLRKVEGNISYECFDQRCRLGETRDGRFVGVAPACVNGYLHVRADGFVETRQLFSTNDARFADVILDRERELKINLTVGGKSLEGDAIVSFVRDDGKSYSAVLPGFENIKLSEGNYEVKVYVYGNSSLILPSSTKYECVDAPREGILGFFGAKKEKCFDITIPETKIERALIGGGQGSVYLLDDELADGNLKIDVDSLPKPNSLDALQNNFELFETKSVRFNFEN